MLRRLNIGEPMDEYAKRRNGEEKRYIRRMFGFGTTNRGITLPPALVDYDFTTGSLTPPAGITLTRAGSKYTRGADGFFVSRANNVLPIHYDQATLQCLGALIEDSLTMNVLRNTDYTDAVWTKTAMLDFSSGSVANSTDTVDDFNTNTMDLIIEDLTGPGVHSVGQATIGVVSSTTHSLYWLLKYAGRRYVKISMYEAGGTTNGIWARYDLVNGVVRELGHYGSGSDPTFALMLYNVAAGTYECRLSGTVKSSAITSVDVVCEYCGDDAAGATISYTGDGVSGVYFGLCQVESGLDVFSSPIVTAGAAASRVRDLMTASATPYNIPTFEIVTAWGKGSRPGATQFDTTNGATTGLRGDYQSTNPPRAMGNGVTLTATDADLSGRTQIISSSASGSEVLTGSNKAWSRKTGATFGTPVCGASIALGGRVGNTNLSFRTIARHRLFGQQNSPAQRNLACSQNGTELPYPIPVFPCWGDSLTAGTGASNAFTTSWPAVFAGLASKGALNYGIAGQTSAQIKDRAYRLPELANMIPIIWAGRNDKNGAVTWDGTENIQTTLDNIDDMVSHCTSGRYIVMSIINRRDQAAEFIGGAGYAKIVAINAALSAAYGSHYLDIRSLLVASYDPGTPQDVIDFGNDCPPSTKSSDGLHQNDSGYAFVAQSAYNKCGAMGYL